MIDRVQEPPLSLCFSFPFFVQAMPAAAAAVSLQRKKSLPDVAQPIQLTATAPLSREEVSVLSSMRREEIRRQIDESERLRANPLLYLVSPQVKVSIPIVLSDNSIVTKFKCKFEFLILICNFQFCYF